MDVPVATYQIELFDGFGNKHILYPVNRYTYEGGMFEAFRFAGLNREPVGDGNVVERMEMALVAHFNNIGGFIVYEVEDEKEGRPEVRGDGSGHPPEEQG